MVVQKSRMKKMTAKTAISSPQASPNVSPTKRNVWRIIAIVFMLLFSSILIVGLIRIDRFKSEHTTATPDQLAMAKSVVEHDLDMKNISRDGFVLAVAQELRKNRAGRQTIDVSVENSTARYVYILDGNTGKILVTMHTEFFDGTNHSTDNQNRPRGMVWNR